MSRLLIALEPEAEGVRVERLLPGPVERAWAWLTQADKLGQWFAEADGDLGPERRDVGAFGVVSSASVYVDARGRSLDEAVATGFPAFDRPIPETAPTVAPGPQTYSTRKVALERALLDGARGPVIVLRPCAVHGPGSTHPREWWFLKRALDGRTRVPLAYEGASLFHTSATMNIAAVLLAALQHPGSRVLNAADPDPPSVRQIGSMIGGAMGHAWELVGLPGRPASGVGRTPWSIPRPFLVDMRAAEALGYRPATTYQGVVGETCRALIAVTRDRPWREAFPALASYPYDLFDYAEEDAAFLSV